MFPRKVIGTVQITDAEGTQLEYGMYQDEYVTIHAEEDDRYWFFDEWSQYEDGSHDEWYVLKTCCNVINLVADDGQLLFGFMYK